MTDALRTGYVFVVAVACASSPACGGSPETAPGAGAALDDGGTSDASVEGGGADDADAGPIADARGDEEGGDDACAAGTLGCRCGAGGECEPGARCAGGVCATCVAGVESCACRPDGTCDGELACIGGLCSSPTCAEGALGCACRAGDAARGTCDGTARCGADSRCHACASDAVGCPCGGACQGDLLCDTGLCRPTRSCAELTALGGCIPHGACIEKTTARDATCVTNACAQGYVWEPSTSSCVPCEGGGCTPPPTCAPGASGSLFAICQAGLEQCVEDADGARCEGCLPGARREGGACVPIVDCGGAVCGPNEYCDPSGGAPSCAPLPCDPGSAQDANGRCTPCTAACVGAGLTGRVWPVRTATGTCACETISGFYLAAGGSAAPEPCDADGDGWVREEVTDPAIASDPALAANARCTTLQADGVMLRDEYGTEREIGSCVEGVLADPTTASCAARVLMPLVESERNDVQGKAVGKRAPAYGVGGRPLDARELNALTKGCVDDLADYDDDGTEDIAEVQEAPESLIVADGRRRLASFAYFMETHRSWFRPATGSSTVGKLVVEERSRCDAAFPLRYDPFVDPAAPTDGFAAGVGPVYWRSCYRNVDPTFIGAKVPGFDFAQWSCDPKQDDCAKLAMAPAPSSRSDLGSIDPLQRPPRDASLCQLTAPPLDHRWRGMHHHSQFKCVRATGTPTEPYDRPIAAFGSTGTLVFDVCRAASCAPSDPGCVQSDSIPASSGYTPRILCSAWDTNVSVTAAPKAVGFAAVRYQDYGDAAEGYTRAAYAGGCVNEDTEWRSALCPFPEYLTSRDVGGFGRFTCGDEALYLWSTGSPSWATLIWDDTKGSVAR